MPGSFSRCCAGSDSSDLSADGDRALRLSDLFHASHLSVFFYRKRWCPARMPISFVGGAPLICTPRHCDGFSVSRDFSSKYVTCIVSSGH
jgi:hypothetical protein